MKSPIWDVSNLVIQIAALKQEFPALQDDEELLTDTLEGETSLFDVLEKLVTQVREQDMLAEGLAARIGALCERQTRHTMRMNFYRGLIYKLMVAAELEKHHTTEGNISVVKSQDKVIITDEAAIPKEYQRVTVEPDKAAIKAALKSGKVILGASLSNGGTTLMIR
jgi:hypothetical protein